MHHRRVFRVCLVALALLFLVACSPSVSPLVGRWETEIEDETLGSMNLVYRFTDDGEVFLEQGEGDEISFSIPFGSYQIRDDQLTISSDGTESVYIFSVTDGQLKLSQSGEETLVFQRLSQ